MPSYVVRATITKQTCAKITGKSIRIYNGTGNNFICDLGPICSIYPMKYGNNKSVLLFHLKNNMMEWVLYNYKQMEIPKNPDLNVFNLIIDSCVSNGIVPVKITIDK